MRYTEKIDIHDIYIVKIDRPQNQSQRTFESFCPGASSPHLHRHVCFTDGSTPSSYAKDLTIS